MAINLVFLNSDASLGSRDVYLSRLLSIYVWGHAAISPTCPIKTPSCSLSVITALRSKGGHRPLSRLMHCLISPRVVQFQPAFQT